MRGENLLQIKGSWYFRGGIWVASQSRVVVVILENLKMEVCYPIILYGVHIISLLIRGEERVGFG